jgi:hypothetical protein
MRAFLRIAAFAFALVPTAALADWQYTKWGMSPEEVVAASNGNAHLVSEAEAAKTFRSAEYVVLLAKGDHSADGEKFSVIFDFTKQAKRLQGVTLKATDPSRCYIYRRVLLNKYGAPVDTNRGPTEDLKWRDLPSGNAVDWIYASPGTCLLQIEPINSDFTNSM